jgi:hypothetical protein
MLAPLHLRILVAASLLATAAVVAACGQATPGRALAVGPLKALHRSLTSHVAIIVMENEEASGVIRNSAAPYINSLARRYGLATASYAITHPSLPNYLALTGGSTQGITSDCTSCQVSASNLVDQLEAAHVSWHAYLEDYPGHCFTGAGAGEYAKKHAPFLYYDDVVRSPSSCRNLVGFGALASDLRHGQLPRFIWITPNLCDDMHDCSVATGDRFLARTVPPLLRELGPHGFLILTWDEGTASSTAGCCSGAAAGGNIATIVAGPGARRGARTAKPVDHYAVLATIEDALALPRLGAAANGANGNLQTLLSTPLPLP